MSIRGKTTLSPFFFPLRRQRVLMRLRRFLPTLLWVMALCCCASFGLTAHAKDADVFPEETSPTGQLLFHSSLWRTLDPHFAALSPAWQRRYQELRSIAEDIDTHSSQLPPLLDNLKTKFLQAQQSVVFLLLDLAPATMQAKENYHILLRLEECDWYLADSVQYVSMAEQVINTYAEVLREVGDALERHSTEVTESHEALAAVLPELQSVHALLDARVASLQASIVSLLRPAETMMQQIEDAIVATQQVQPRLWVRYYTQPMRFSQLGWQRRWIDLQNIKETLQRGTVYSRPLIITVLLGMFILGGSTLLFRSLQKRFAVPLPDNASLWEALGAALNAQSPQRKYALALGTVCSVNLVLDALPSVHVHMPFLIIQSCLLLVSVGIWAHNAQDDPPLLLLLTPILVGYVLLEGSAAPLWIMGAMLGLLPVCACILSRCQRSPFAHMWLAALLLGIVCSALGFARMTVLGLSLVLFCRASYVVLWTLFHARGIAQQPLRLLSLLPLMVAWLYCLGEITGLAFTGLDILWGQAQEELQQSFGVQIRLRELLLVAGTGLGLLAFASVSRQMLCAAVNRHNVLDVSAVPVIHAVINSLLWLLFLLLALGLLGMDIRSLAFIGGALTVGIGLGLQNIISNFFSGLVIIFGRMVRGGDFIEIGSVRGHVHSVNMRATVVKSLEGASLLVPNVAMLNGNLINWTRDNRHVREDVRVRLTQNNDVDAAMRIMEATASRCSGILPNPAPVALLLKSDESVVDIILQVWVSDVDTRPASLSALQKDLYHALTAAGMNLATPHVDVVMKQA